MMGIRLILMFFVLVWSAQLSAQSKQEIRKGSFDSLQTPASKIITDTLIIDTTAKRVHSPQKATLRSAILPGWGQAYNRQYWKIPLVYAVIGIPAATYFYNNTWYKKSKFAYETRLNKDSANFSKIDPNLQEGVVSVASVQYYRNQFRQSRDYSILYTLLAWGLNVVDATVSGHLKEFDVSDDLSLRIDPIIRPGTHTKGLSLVLAFKTSTPRILSVQ